MSSKADVRCGVTDEVKTKILPSLDRTKFLGFSDDDRISVYVFAVALATKLQLPPMEGTFKGLVMMKSVPDEELAQMMLAYLSVNAKKSLPTIIDDVGESRRKELVQAVNEIANSGFKAIVDLNATPEEIVIANMIKDMDEMYKEHQKKHPECKLPAFHAFRSTSSGIK